LFLLPRGRPRPRGAVGKAGRQETLDGKEDGAAEEESV
jgi:hypothetical protein